MVVTLIGKEKLQKLILPSTPEGSYWINERAEKGEKKLLNIEGANDNWQIVSNDNVKIINAQYVSFKDGKASVIPDKYAVIKKVILKNGGMYFVSIGSLDEVFVVYCTERYEQNVIHLELIEKTEITIGRIGENDICYSNALVSNNHAKIYYEANTWKIVNYDEKYGTYLNNKQIGSSICNLKNGDIIFILGLKMVFIGNGIYVNNPSDKMKYLLKNFKLHNDEIPVDSTKEDDNEDIELYSEKDYFSRAPRIVNKIEKEKITIDAPPARKDDEDMPMLLTMGSSLSMGVMMVISMYTTIDGLKNESLTVKESIPKFIMVFAMLIAMILIPVITRQWQKGQRRKYEKKRQQRYRKYINSKIMAVNEIMDKQRDILNQNYVSAKDSENIVLNNESRIWERKMEDDEFLSVRVGNGDVPLDIDLQYPRETFTMEDDKLVEILNEIAHKSKILEDAPVTVSLLKKNISSIITNDNNRAVEYVKGIIMQLVALHSYIDLKLVFLVQDDKDKKWDFVKMLPHLWNSTKQVRFFADNNNDMKQLSKYLEEVIENRNEYTNDNIDYRQFIPYYLIITDDYKRIEGLKIINDVLKMKKNVGFSLLCMTNDLTQLPNECKTFIMIDGENGKVFENENSATTQVEFKVNKDENLDFEMVTSKLANIPIKYSETGSAMLPETYSFLEMYDVGKIEQLNIYERWRSNDTTLSLQAPVGIDASGIQISLDIHEKFHGPHGLIAGSTGSGKSEFIITYILSLAINYHPDDVNFVLIDYKGGGLAGAFKKRDIKLPHLVGTITNIDTVGLQRSLDSIQSELRRRQIMFNKARDITTESTIDIYKYQRFYHEGVVDTPIPHLFIICDEFAELKQQQPDFMDELISVARIGRSLGVHLILATQKPAGIVNDQIRGNSKFGVCLKVQDKSDSMDVIKKPDAAKLKRAGQFYINVGNDEYFALGQSAWAGAQYFPSDVTKKEIDTSIEFISNIGSTIRKINSEVKKQKIASQGDQLTNIVEYICKIANTKNIVEKQLWLDSIPADIYSRGLKEKYNFKPEKNVINPIIGEYDDPSNQKQDLLTLNLSTEGNTMIYGSADSGKEMLLNTIVYDIITTHTSDEASIYILDFGNEALNIYKDAPQVGDVVLVNDNERVTRFFEMIKKEINVRKKVLLKYNGDYSTYVKNANKPMPQLICILNNYGNFAENYENFEEELQMVTRDCTKYGIAFIITASSYRDIRFRLIQNFKRKLSLQLNNEDDYLYVFDKIGKKRPSHIHGRGLVPMENGSIYEFQTAQACRAEHQSEHIAEVIQKLKSIDKNRAKKIPIMPEVVEIENVKDAIKDISRVPIGISVKSLGVYTFNYKKNKVSIVIGKDIENISPFISKIVEEINMIKNTEGVYFSINSKFDDAMSVYNKILESDGLNDNNYTVIVVEDIDSFIGFLPEGSKTFEEIVGKIVNSNNMSIIIVDNAMKIKGHQFDQWYKSNITGDTGIWVGNGVDSQYIITADINRRELVNSNCIGYGINQGIATQIKLLGIKKKGDENE